MPARHRLPVRLASVTFLLVFLVAAIYGKCLEAQRLRPHGRFNEPQILERGNSIGSAILSHVGHLQVHANRTAHQNQDGSVHPAWFLDYISDDGESVLRLGFDGETGDLHFATVCQTQKFQDYSRFARPGALSPEAAMRVSRDWVHTLGLAPKIGPWEVMHNPHAKGRIWQIVWRSPRHTLHFSLDRFTGRLVMAQLQV